MALADADSPSRQSGSNPNDPGVGDTKFSVAPPSLSLPKGGGAVRGIGEKFTASPATGTGSLSIPIATSPGRSGFGPQLKLTYDSGSGNGPFGFGWSLGLPTITRKTAKGLPLYRDEEESDIFVLSGGEDLVPVVGTDGRRYEDRTSVVGFTIHRYRPRVEGPFARIERWTRRKDGDVHWRSLSKDNILTLYGLGAEARIADPSPIRAAEQQRVFSWLICESRDDKGNALIYRYKAEDGTQIELGNVHERNRGPSDDPRRSANRYLKRICYGNRKPLLDASGERPLFLDPVRIESADWMFETVFDYGDHDRLAPKSRDNEAMDPTGRPKYPWSRRPDPHSSYRPGFEVRTARLCQRVLMFHHFLGTEQSGVGIDCLVRSTDFTYSDDLDPTDVRNPIYAFLRSISQTSYTRQGEGYDRRSIPPVEFEYSVPAVQDAVLEVDSLSIENLPAGLGGSSCFWTDLHGEGVPGILAEQAGAWYYKRNLSPLPDSPPNHHPSPRARFAPLETVDIQPRAELGGGWEFRDVAGNGRCDLVMKNGPVSGLYLHDESEGWEPFRPFASRLNRDWHDPNLRFIDLNGDGRADVLITEDEAFVWHASLAEAGFGPARRATQALDEEDGPRVVFADGTQSIHLADLSGDGLADIVRIRNGEICYWPNLGHCRFGAKVTMDNAPSFDHPDQFDPRRLRLADIDGSGTTDAIYLHRDGVRLYFNQSGNSWSQPQQLRAFPRVDDLSSIVALDLLGNGTACLVWSSPNPGDAHSPMRYVNLTGDFKPHLLVGTMNNLGAETRIDYAPSTKFYLQDKRDGRPWITRLPFPVHVVERVEVIDRIGRNRFMTSYVYHHGYFDPEEREFHGFGMVEQVDTECFTVMTDGQTPAENVTSESHVPQLHTKTWFHTGVYLGGDSVRAYYAGLLNATDHGEYFREPALTNVQARDLLLPDTVLPAGLSLEEEREACRALRGSMLRQEVYANDAGRGASAEQIQRAQTPFVVSEHNFGVRCLQPRGNNKHAVFFVHPREAIHYHYERNPSDPRIGHEMVLEVDAFGNVLKRVSIGYGRRTQLLILDAGGKAHQVPNAALAALHVEDQEKQTTPLLVYVERRVTNAIDSNTAYRNPLPCEEVTFELTGYTPTGPADRYQASDFVEPDPVVPDRQRHKFVAPEVPYEAVANGSERRRAIERLRTIYRADDMRDLLPLGDMQPLALPGENYKLAFTPGLLDEVFHRSVTGQPSESLIPTPAAVLGGQAGDRGGYLQSQTLKADGRFPTSDPDDHWWVPSGRSFYSDKPNDTAANELLEARQHFFLTRRYQDPFGQSAFVDFDDNDLLMIETRDALGNRLTARVNDYRLLHPRVASDPNRNQVEVVFDTLGMVVGTAVMGKAAPAPVEGDTLSGFVTDLTQAQLDGIFDAADPSAMSAALLGGATTRIVYDIDRFRRTRQANPNDPDQWQPACAASLMRETHVSDPLPPQGLQIRVDFAYSDGFGREIQKKVRAEPGVVVEGGPVVDPRWIGSGWTIFNNKGKPVRKYEPFFSATQRFEFGPKFGVSPVQFYDPVDRVIATLYPNHTYEKVVFDPWQQTSYDVNDTCAPRNSQTGDPRTDPDVAGYVAEYFKSQPLTWQTWFGLRSGGAMGPDEQAAAASASAHADTPVSSHFDVLGRSFLHEARNRVVCSGHDLDGTEDLVATRVELDIEANQRSVRDAVQQAGDPLGRIVARYAYDMLGNPIYRTCMEAGSRWMLNDVVGKPVRTWDSRGHNFSSRYDELRRPIEQTVRGTVASGVAASDPRTLLRDLLVDKVEYGEGLVNADVLNLRTRVYRHFDSAGVAVNARLDDDGNPTDAFDFKGNQLRSTRLLVSDFKNIPDWSASPQLDSERFEAGNRYDALNRIVQAIAPHGVSVTAQGPERISVVQPLFNETGLLNRVNVWLEGAAEPGSLLDPIADPPSQVGIANIQHDAKGQRVQIDYKNGASTFYGYDRFTFRLTHLRTRRSAVAFPDDDPVPPIPGWPGSQVQNVSYTYDPVGNITHVRDDAQQIIYFKNRRVEASNDYVYDALYRLIQATGREHLGQGGAPSPYSYTDAGRSVLSAKPAGRFAPDEVSTMALYTERYVLDAVGNFQQLQHSRSDAAAPGWARVYAYDEESQIEPGKRSNRLSRSTIGGVTESYSSAHDGYDAHGNMLRMPQLQTMRWDYRDQLQMSQRQKVNPQDVEGDDRQGEQTWYVYDAAGQRVRKVTQLAGSGGLKDERLYLGGFEVHRRHSGVGAGLQRETLHFMDGKQRIALVETRNDVDDGSPRQLVRYQLSNHLGSAVVELDDQAQIISYEEYAPYGSTTYQAVRSRTEAAKRYRYTGKERDEESGLYYYGARYYAAWLGRWTSCDPAGLSAAPNLFVYANGNPVHLIDPDGREPTVCMACDPAKAHPNDVVFDTLIQLANEQTPAAGMASDILRAMAGMFIKVDPGPYKSTGVSMDVRAINNFLTNYGLSDAAKARVSDAVWSYRPRSNPVLADERGVGTRQQLAASDQAERIQNFLSIGTGTGHLFAGLAAAFGADTARIKAFGQLGDILESAAMLAGAAAMNRSTQQATNSTSASSSGLVQGRTRFRGALSFELAEIKAVTASSAAAGLKKVSEEYALRLQAGQAYSLITYDAQGNLFMRQFVVSGNPLINDVEVFRGSVGRLPSGLMPKGTSFQEGEFGNQMETAIRTYMRTQVTGDVYEKKDSSASGEDLTRVGASVNKQPRLNLLDPRVR